MKAATMNHPLPSWRRGGALLAALLVLATPLTAAADEGPRGLRVPLLPKYVQECSACHLAFAPGLLPAASWQRLMSNLPRHFGTDASLDAATAAELSAWLAAHAGSGRRQAAAPPEDRITRSAWFVHEHAGIAARTWSLPAVGSAANCSACHGGAEQGDFRERHVRIPR
jgi:hypothetical protein